MMITLAVMVMIMMVMVMMACKFLLSATYEETFKGNGDDDKIDDDDGGDDCDGDDGDRE